MSMTKNEAIQRASRIWPEEKVIEAKAGTKSQHGHKWWIKTDASDHFLDGNGHPTCHAGCKAAESDLTG